MSERECVFERETEIEKECVCMIVSVNKCVCNPNMEMNCVNKTEVNQFLINTFFYPDN